MANSLNLRDVTLNQTNVLGRRSTVAQVIDTRPRYKIDPQTRQRTDTLDGFNVTILAALSKPQDVKLPLEAESVIKQIDEAIHNEGKQVFVSFGSPTSTLRGKFYAMLNNGQLVSGLSCTASEITIAKISEESDDYEDDFIIE